MNLTFKNNIPKDEYMSFLKKSKHYNITQTPMWAEVKTGWSSNLCGLYDDGVLVAASLLLIRKLAPMLKIIYSPRGYLLDFSNKEYLKAFTEGVFSYAKSIGAYLVRIDPEIILSENFMGKESFCEEGYQQLENIKDTGYLHMGFAKDFHSYTQPRFNAEYKLCDENYQKLSDEAILSGFDKKLKKFIGRYTEERGIYFEEKTGVLYAQDFYEISEHTEKRQNILLRDSEYFKRIAASFEDDTVFFFSKMNIDKFIAFTHIQIEKGGDTSQAEEDLQIAKKLREKSETITLSALLTIKSNDTAYLMYSGFDDIHFSRFRTTNQIRYEAMRYFRDKGCKIFSFMGIDGNLSDPLSTFKLKFNPRVVEYAGECELPVNKFIYKIMTKLFPIMKRCYIRFMLLIKGKK